MSRSLYPSFAAAFAAVLAMAIQADLAVAGSPVPAPAVDIPAASVQGPQTAVFAGGCFWGVEAVFRHVKGVSKAVSGYAGGSFKTADYERVSTGSTGHAESVEVTYDPAQVSYGELLRIFFSVAHDPTQLNRQGPDYGTQYRSAIFYVSDEQKRVAQAYIAQLGQAKAYPSAIVTQVVALPAFYAAEAYHQNYLALHPTQPYIVMHDLPKLAQLKQQFPDRYVAK
ncbi:MAG: peptide-methionine (S)-S-oxide reductase MsrA [Betaproteobacteria bacterium]|nr:MAG: peptide-methionine (S)-S-oxide reductase MsrA [Betaproteobacteria bacterium]TMH50752.1 MAG: peptide-methionine (S)-S-oxide reductase MsrA [Betaproteobacteria bacterium]